MAEGWRRLHTAHRYVEHHAGLATLSIEDVQIGQAVWAWDEVAGRPVKRAVTQVFRHRRKPIVRVFIRGQRGQQFIDATLEHPFWVMGSGWVPARELKPRDVLRDMADTGSVEVSHVVGAGTTDVFNFEVGGAHNYFVGRHGVLVHNKSRQQIESPKRDTESRSSLPPTQHSLGISPLVFESPNTMRWLSRAGLAVSLLAGGKHIVQTHGPAFNAAVELANSNPGSSPLQPYVKAGRALIGDPVFRDNLVDAGGRALAASSFSSVPGLSSAEGKGIMEPSRMAVASAMWIGYGLSGSLDIALRGAARWSGATTHAEHWRKPMWEMGQAAITNMASQQAGMFLPAAGQGAWGTPTRQVLGKLGTEFVVSQATRQGMNWLAHEYVDPAVQPFQAGVLPTLTTSGIKLGLGYALTHPAVLDRAFKGAPIPWEYRALAWGTARYIGDHVLPYGEGLSLSRAPLR